MIRRAPTYLRQWGDGEGLVPRQASIILHMGVVKAPLCRHFYLATDKDGDLPSKPEKSERALMKVMRRFQRPIALFIDDGHGLALLEGTCDNTPQAISLL